MPDLQLHTQAGCGLAIGRYPRFRYDARGGGGLSQLGEPDPAGWRALEFDPATLLIPPLDFHTTRFLGLPLPPGLRIDVIPERLRGRGHLATGELELHFRARFRFSMFAAYRAPDLLVEVDLRSEAVSSARHRVRGQRLDGRGEGLLVGVALVPATGERWFDRFLGLPDEALALLRCQFRQLPAPESIPQASTDQPWNHG